MEKDLLQWLQLKERIHRAEEELASLRKELLLVEKENYMIAEVKGVLRRRAKGSQARPSEEQRKNEERVFTPLEEDEATMREPAFVEAPWPEEEEVGTGGQIENLSTEGEEEKARSEGEEEEKGRKRSTGEKKKMPASQREEPREEKKRKRTEEIEEKKKRKRSTEADARMRVIRKRSSQQSPFETTRVDLPKKQ